MNRQDIKVQDLSSFRVPEGFRGRNAAFVQSWWIVQSLLFKTSPQFMYGWRRFLLKLFGAQIGKGVLVRSSARITYPWKLTIGDYSWVGDNVDLYTLGDITIGSNVVVSQGSYLCTGSHNYGKPSFDIFAKPIYIEDEAWIASQAFIGPGVQIKRGAIVGARSLVLTDIPAYGVAYGSPAKTVGTRVEHQV